MVASVSDEIADEVASVTEQIRNTFPSDSMVRTLVKQEIGTINPVMKDHHLYSTPSSSIMPVSTKPLPSIRRLPTLPLLHVATELPEVGLMTGNANRVIENRKMMGKEGMSWRRVRREAGWEAVDRTVKRDRRMLMW